MGLAVDPPCHPADDHEPGPGELAGECATDRAAVRRASTCPNDRDCGPREGVHLGVPTEEECGGRVVDRAEEGRKAAIAATKTACGHAVGRSAGIR